MSFWEKYKPLIVMVPAIVGLHIGWFWLQGNEALNPEAKNEKLTEQPIVSVGLHFQQVNGQSNVYFSNGPFFHFAGGEENLSESD